LIDSRNRFSVNADIVLVLSNRKAAYGLVRAQNATPPIPTAYLALQPWLKANPGKTRDDYDAQVAQTVLEARPDLVVLAGWMHVLGDGFLERLSQAPSNITPESQSSSLSDHKFPIPVINLHPALPGAFDGANALDRAWDAYKEGKIDKTGVMVHRVIRQVDAGAPVLTQEIPFRDDETKEEFEARLHRVEWQIIVSATNVILEERLKQLQG
jgi:phosphoribosylglycinamide formyltransferase